MYKLITSQILRNILYVCTYYIFNKKRNYLKNKNKYYILDVLENVCDVNDVNDVNDIHDVNDVHDINEVDNVNDVNDVNDIIDVHNVNDINDCETHNRCHTCCGMYYILF